MTRPASGTDLKLLAAGRKLAAQNGLSGLSIREVCAMAGVNLGMFHYHFKSKKNFEQAILKDIYSAFMETLHLEVATGKTPRERLKNVLRAFGRMARDNRALVAVIFKDVANGNKETMAFVRGNFIEHVRLVHKVLVECRRAGIMTGMSLPNMLVCLVLPVVIPCAGVGLVEKSGAGDFFPVPMVFVRRSLLTDKAIDERVEAVLRMTERGGYDA